jgi:hypothetical protein
MSRPGGPDMEHIGQRYEYVDFSTGQLYGFVAVRLRAGQGPLTRLERSSAAQAAATALWGKLGQLVVHERTGEPNRSGES